MLKLPAALGAGDRHDITTPEALAQLPGLPDVIHATALEQLSPAGADQWLALMQRFARVTAGSRPRPTILCPVTVPARLRALPATAPGLAVSWWSGIPSATELRLACRDESDAGDRARRLWREHVLASMSGDDLRLGECLWDAIFDSRDAVRRSLLRYAQDRGWTPKILEEAGAARFASSPVGRRPGDSPGELALWTLGGLTLTEEFGIELHAAAMAVLGRDADWIHRLWRGQATLILPLLEDLRLRVCRRLSETFGDNWPFRWQAPATDEERREVKDTALAASWGFLAHLYRTVPLLATDAATASLIEGARFIRNELSHNRTVSYVDFKALHDRVDEFIARKNRSG